MDGLWSLSCFKASLKWPFKTLQCLTLGFTSQHESWHLGYVTLKQERNKHKLSKISIYVVALRFPFTGTKPGKTDQ